MYYRFSHYRHGLWFFVSILCVGKYNMEDAKLIVLYCGSVVALVLTILLIAQINAVDRPQVKKRVIFLETPKGIVGVDKPHAEKELKEIKDHLEKAEIVPNDRTVKMIEESIRDLARFIKGNPTYEEVLCKEDLRAVESERLLNDYLMPEVIGTEKDFKQLLSWDDHEREMEKSPKARLANKAKPQLLTSE